MKKMNVIVVFNQNRESILMCKRKKEPYKGMLNLVGGKIETDDYLSEAYRELFEETGISKNDILLNHLMNFQYIKKDFELQVFYGTLNKEVDLVEEVNKLIWISTSENFFDKDKFAGEGNIGHMLEEINLEK